MFDVEQLASSYTGSRLAYQPIWQKNGLCKIKMDFVNNFYLFCTSIFTELNGHGGENNYRNHKTPMRLHIVK